MTTQQALRNVPPPEFLQLAGHPLRWRLLSELARSDRMVQELTGLIGEPQNLVSYHLGKLRDGRLVSARRSSADRRDACYTVHLARLRLPRSGLSGQCLRYQVRPRHLLQGGQRQLRKEKRRAPTTVVRKI